MENIICQLLYLGGVGCNVVEDVDENQEEGYEEGHTPCEGEGEGSECSLVKWRKLANVVQVLHKRQITI